MRITPSKLQVAIAVMLATNVILAGTAISSGVAQVNRSEATSHLFDATELADGRDPSLCSVDESRGKIPDNFIADACFDGDVLTLVNRTKWTPLIVSGRNIEQFAPIGPAPEVADALYDFVRGHGNVGTVLFPGYSAKIQIYRDETLVRVTRPTSAGAIAHIVLQVVSGFLPRFAGLAVDLPGFVNELTRAADKYVACEFHGNWVQKRFCTAIFRRDSAFAALRFSGKQILGIFDTVWETINSSYQRVLDGPEIDPNASTEFTLAAKASGSQEANPGGSGGAPDGGGNDVTSPPGPGGPGPVQVGPKPRASDLVVVVYGGGHVGVAFNVGWDAGRDPVVCHFFRDGVEVYTAQCGTHASKQFYGVPPGVHSFYATVSDRFGVYSDPTNTVTKSTN